MLFDDFPCFLNQTVELGVFSFVHPHDGESKANEDYS
jgi:hypothetical protein